MDQPKIERVLRLMKYLTANTSYTIAELAYKLDTSQRSIYRYLDTFKEAGFVVQKQGDFYRLGKESRYFKEISELIHFTEEEAFIFNKLLDGLDDTNVLKQNLRRKLSSVYNCTAMADCVVKGKVSSNVHFLIEAIENHKEAKLYKYASSHTGKISDRLVEPFAFTTNYVQVWCYDCGDNECKLFSTSRMESVEVLCKDWEYEKWHKEGYIDIFRMSGYNKIHIKLELGIMAHNLILEEFPLSERDIKELSTRRWLLDTYVTSYSGVARFVIGLLDDIKIIDSHGLKVYIGNFINKSGISYN